MPNREPQIDVRDWLGETIQIERTISTTGWFDAIPASSVSGAIDAIAIQTPATGTNETLQVDLTGQGIPWDIFGSFAWSPKKKITNFKVRATVPPITYQLIVNREEVDA